MISLSLAPPPTVVAGVVALQALYSLCAGPYRNRFPRSRPVARTRQSLFSTGLLVLLLALASPLDDLSDHYLFTAHMVQHLMLTLAAAPLLLAGTPGWLLVDLLRTTGASGLARRLMHPLLAFGLFNGIFAFSHVPQVYDFALASEPVHAAEHLVFLATGVLLWMPVLSPAPSTLPRYHQLGQILYLFLQVVPASLVGAFLSGAPGPFYATYATAPRIFAISPLADQQLGGLIMWVGSGLYFLLATAVVFFLWASGEEAANRRPAGAARGWQA